MSHAEHEWAKEQIAAHLAGGLPADERARLEAHTASCAECIAEIDAARRFDRQMDELFAPVRAKAGLEERVIRVLRCALSRQPRSLAARVMLSAAALVLMGILGFVLVQVDQGGDVEVFAQRKIARVEAEKVPEDGIVKTPGLHARSRSETLSREEADRWAEERGKRRAETGATFSVDELKESGRGESADRENTRAKNGDSKDFLGYARGAARGFGGQNMPTNAAPAEPAAASPPPPVVAEMQEKVLALQEQGQRVYSLRDDAAAQNKAELNYFKPGDVAGAAAPKAPEELAKLKAVVTGPGRGEFKDAKQQLLAQKGGGAANEHPADDRKPQGGAPQDPPAQQPEKVQRKVIRTGEVEYEIESFDSSVATISKLVEEEAGYVATVNSDKLPNGKVRGTVVVRCPPERLDTLLLKLRGLGELKSQNIRSQDVGKQYYDLESRLKAARTMEERLLKIIKEGKGEIKDLLLAEKELGEWRTKIETFEGEKRYYDNQISMSTLTITLSEKEIRAPSAVTQTERVNMGLEVEDVEKAHKDALAAVADAKGRVTRSELKQLAAGQFSATLHFEVTPDGSGPLRDRFKQLGTVARLDIDRVQETEGGVGKVAEVLKVKQKDTQFFVSIYNLANIAPRETVVLSLACADAEASYKAILARIEKAGGRVVTSSLNRQKNDQTSGMLRFEIRAADAEAVLGDVRAAGEVMRLDVNENPDTQNVTKSKRGFQVELSAMGRVEPRETTTLQIGSRDVAEAFRKLQEALTGAEARILTAQLNENDRQNINATLNFEFRRDQDAKIQAAMSAAGEVMYRTSTRSQESDRVVDSKRRIQLTLINVASIPPRETYTLEVTVEQVEGAVTALEAMAAELKGRIVDSRHTRTADGRSISGLIVDLPLGAARGAADRIKNLGHTRLYEINRNPQAPEGDLALGRLRVNFSNPDPLVSSDSGPWARIKSGLAVSITALSWGLTFVVVGLCLVVPIGGVAWLVLRIYRKSKASATPAA
jgi:hypothetical protein